MNMLVWWLALSPHSSKVLGLHVLPVPARTPTVQTHTLADSKPAVGVNVSVSGYLCLCVIDWQPLRVVPHLLSCNSWHRLPATQS